VVAEGGGGGAGIHLQVSEATASKLHAALVSSGRHCSAHAAMRGAMPVVERRRLHESPHAVLPLQFADGT
jgi:hypothetical protein